ncbi:hypothetical protein COLSTE_01233 [Collinsella stercoris DSM 13279]|uniref:Uncharacterized protein n=1 Tax=Collinsella stercoris DSM 13279 TaxID=445975 RepID=B6GAY1_9ACTN|nr:hypothetical protein COLSTE_01233 [Collinsella stercoris DSM 13279]
MEKSDISHSFPACRGFAQNELAFRLFHLLFQTIDISETMR